MRDEWTVQHTYSMEEWQEDAEELRHGVPLDKFLYNRMRRALSDYFLREEIAPISTHIWFYEGHCDLEAKFCTLIVRYGFDPEQRWIIKKADLEPEPPEHLKPHPAHFDYVWQYIEDNFSVADIAHLRNKTEQTLKLL